jgi:hypothetical protein
MPQTSSGCGSAHSERLVVPIAVKTPPTANHAAPVHFHSTDMQVPMQDELSPFFIP